MERKVVKKVGRVDVGWGASVEAEIDPDSMLEAEVVPERPDYYVGRVKRWRIRVRARELKPRRILA